MGIAAIVIMIVIVVPAIIVDIVIQGSNNNGNDTPYGTYSPVSCFVPGSQMPFWKRPPVQVVMEMSVLSSG